MKASLSFCKSLPGVKYSHTLAIIQNDLKSADLLMDSNFFYKKRFYSPRIVYCMRCVAVGDDRMPTVRRDK